MSPRPGETATFRYRALRADGSRETGHLEAGSDKSALEQLRARGLTPVTLRPLPQAGTVRSWFRPPALTSAERLSFLRDLANLLEAGIALEPALGLVGEKMERASAQGLVEDVRRRVRAGEGLARAMVAQGGLFPPEAQGMVAAGEQAGGLAASLSHLADLEEGRTTFRQKLVSALIYPALVGLLTLAALALLSGYVIPQFENLFEGSGTRLPASTAAVLAAGRFLGEFGPWLLLLPAMGGLAIVRLRRRPVVRLAMDGWLVRRTGPLGRLVRDAEIAVYTRTLAALLGGGVPLADALATAGLCLSNRALAGAAQRASERVRGGTSLSRAMSAEPLFPQRLARLVALAEQATALPRALSNLANLLERERTTALGRLLALLVPGLTLVLGGLIGTIFAALISGIMSINDIAA
ncbi:type II secretion system F family protein [Niveispirillum fermenti]|uniref:type II secretion system F family protein n=1 Tax=Niveispirillum fermenti TaxID=1233113 RepID=UPI003A880213